jgi:predicted methyltransferase
METRRAGASLAGMRNLAIAVLLAAAPLIAGLAACSAVSPETNVRPGINDDYTNPALDVDMMVKRFEAESREVFAKRSAIARAVGLSPGMAVADVGAGTGVFVDFFAGDVQANGKVYAVDIAPKFVEHLRERAAARNQPQVEAVLCTADDAKLPAASCDAVFTCDTYHHFEYPHSTLTSIHRALRPHGQLVIVDFERIPGVSRQWTLDHVRCDKQQVIREVLAAGFVLVEEVPVGLHENYLLRFRRA